MTALLSFHGDQKIKTKYLARVRAHAKADEIIKGTYWEYGKGCAVGCTVHSSDHSAYETELGLPEWLARLEDTLFEGLPNRHAKAFPAKFLSAIPVGKNLEPVRWRFCSFLLGENIERVKNLQIDDKLKAQILAAIEQCKKLHDEAVETGSWNESAARSAAAAAAATATSAAESAAWSARSARSAAESAARSAAWSAAESAWSAARSAAWSASESAWSAAWSAAESARSAARSAAYIRYADKLLELLRAA